jgi:hypothetical protein
MPINDDIRIEGGEVSQLPNSIAVDNEVSQLTSIIAVDTTAEAADSTPPETATTPI